MTDGLEAARDEYGLTESERWETLMQGFSDHHRGDHDWSSVDPYDCSVCSALVNLYADVVRLNAPRSRESALRAAAQDLWDITAHLFDDAQNPVVLVSLAKARDAMDDALAGAPWEPSEEQVGRAAHAMWQFDVDHGQYTSTEPPSPPEPDDYEWDLARVALRAAFSAHQESLPQTT